MKVGQIAFALLVELLVFGTAVQGAAQKEPSSLVYSSTQDEGHAHRDHRVLSSLNRYELHDLSSLLSSARRRLASTDEHVIQLSVFGRSLEVSLVRNTALFAPNYIHSYVDEHGKEVKSEGALKCIYTAQVKEFSVSKGAAALCDDNEIMTTVFGDISFTVEPVKVRQNGRETEELLHAIYIHEDLKVNPVNMTRMVFPPEHPQVLLNNDASRVAKVSAEASTPDNVEGSFVDSKIKYVGLLQVNDNAYYDKYGAQVQVKAAQRLAVSQSYYQIIPNSAAYKPVVTVSKMVTFMVKDPYKALYTSDGRLVDNQLLGIFGNWLSTSGYQVDAALLFTGTPFSTAAGWGFVGTVCDRGNGANVGVVDATGADASTSVVAAHELGHVLGAQHDDVQVPTWGRDCQAATGIMGRRLQTSASFSTCTLEWWRLQFTPTRSSYNTNSNPACPEQPPSAMASGPICGNGLVENGEDCDCPNGDCSGNPCCNGATCSFKAGATCAAHQQCCDSSTCQAKSANSVCRASTGDCDVAETCDGSSPECPSDARKPIGTTCSRTLAGNTISSGTCTCDGCMSHQEKCRLMNSIYVAPCSFMSSGDSMCDVVWCQDSSQQCSGYNLPTTTGMRCGAGLACMNKKCVPQGQVTCPYQLVATFAPVKSNPAASPTPKPTPKATDPPTDPPTNPPTNPPTSKTTNKPTVKPTNKPTAKPPTRVGTKYPTRRRRRGLEEAEMTTMATVDQ